MHPLNKLSNTINLDGQFKWNIKMRSGTNKMRKNIILFSKDLAIKKGNRKTHLEQKIVVYDKQYKNRNTNTSYIASQ